MSKNLKATVGIVALSFVTLTAFASCKDTKKEQAHKHQTEMRHEHGNSDAHHNVEKETESKRQISDTTQEKADITTILDAYIAIKNGLVGDSKESSAKGATAMLSAFAAFDMTKLSGDTHKEYMEILESAKEQAEHIVKSPIDHQREHFDTLSTDMIDLITLLGTDKTLYVDHCPMAKASWLSETKDIKNPYYGSKMMTCGSVKKQIN